MVAMDMVTIRGPDRANSTTELLPHEQDDAQMFKTQIGGNYLYSSAILQCTKVNFWVVFVHF